MTINKNNAARFAAVLITAFAIGTLSAAYNEIGTDFPMTGPTDFIAEAGVTNVYTGFISGTGPAVIKGGGTVAFSHPNNTYTGGTTVNDAVFRLDADGCAGTGAITGAVTTSHVFMNCANVPNDILFLQRYSVKTQLAPSTYPDAEQCCILPLQSSVSVKGLVTLKKSSYLFNETSPAIVSSPTVTYEKGISGSGYIFTLPKGRMVFARRYVSTYSNRSRLGGVSGSKGTMEFRASSNELYRADMYNANLDFKAVDVFPNTLFHYEYGADGYCKTYLNGNDQTILGFSWGTDGSRPQPTETGTGQCWTSTDSPATVRITGCDPSRVNGPNPSIGTLVNQLALFGKITLVMDVNPTYTEQGFYQDFSVRKSTMSGDLIISNGDFRVSSTASFQNVPNIYVGVGGSFTNASTTASAFVGCTNLTVLGTMACTGNATPFGDATMALTLGSGAKFSLPAGATATVKSLTVGGIAMPDDTYGDGGTALAQIEQGSVVVRSGNLYVDCENGDDANDGTVERPFKTIRAATSISRSGDVIHVAPGTYGELEGEQRTSATDVVGIRVIIPEGVMLIGTEGAENTLIVGAEAPIEDVDNETYRTGTNGVRCVYAHDNTKIRGFTLTGGRVVGIETSGNYGAGLYSKTALGATIEDCIVSNNAGFAATIYQAVVRRCRVLNNVALRMNSKDVSDKSGSAGSSCSWYNSIIDGNKGNAVLYLPQRIESCTFGTNQMYPSGSAQTLYNSCPVLNSLFLYGSDRFQGVVYATNCVFRRNVNTTSLLAENCGNCLFNQSDANIKIDSAYRLLPGSVAIDAGTNELSTISLADETDILGTPRILNKKIDIGAVEYDWRPAFSAVLGRRFAIAEVSPSVTTNATGGLLVPDGVVAGKASSAGPYEISFILTGGSLSVYVGGELAGESSGTGEQSIRFTVANAADEIRFVYKSEAGSTAVLSKFSGACGFSISLR